MHWGLGIGIRTGGGLGNRSSTVSSADTETVNERIKFVR